MGSVLLSCIEKWHNKVYIIIIIVITLLFIITHIIDRLHLGLFFLLFLCTLGLGYCIPNRPQTQRQNVAGLPYGHVSIGADKEAHALGVILALVVLGSLQGSVEHQRAQLTVGLRGQQFQLLLQEFGHLQSVIPHMSTTAVSFKCLGTCNPLPHTHQQQQFPSQAFGHLQFVIQHTSTTAV